MQEPITTDGSEILDEIVLIAQKVYEWLLRTNVGKNTG